MTLKDLFDRYGPSLAVVAVLALLVIAIPDGDGNDASEVATRGPGASVGVGGAAASDAATADRLAAAAGDARTAAAGPSRAASGSAAGGSPAGGAPSGAATAKASTQGAVPPGAANVSFGSGPNCRPDGRQDQIWLYAPVCVQPWPKGADNGGATDQGVTRDKILIVRYLPQTDPATQAALRGLGAEDTREDQKRIYEVLRRYMNTHTETYGREVVFQDVDASGPNDNDEALKSDAVRIANEIKAFAVFGQTLQSVFAEELAQRGVPCTCIRSQSRGYYERNPPYIFGDLPTIEDYYVSIAEYIGKRLANKPAKWAGDAAMQAQPRKFGLIYVEGEGKKANPDLKAARDFYIEELKKYGVTLTQDVGYLVDVGQATDQSASIISKMKSAGVSNLLFIGDPLYPIFLTKEATRQTYFPEWFISGTLLSDTSFFGRTYDQQQWSRAFGMSPLWVFFEDVSQSYGYRMYHHMRPAAPRGEEGVGINVYASPVQNTFNGIQMAGPNLTREKWVQAMFALPRTGGIPAAPLVYYTRESPNAIKDFVEVWWNATGTGKDETGRDGAGTMMKANGGQRFEIGEWPTTEPNAFDPNGAVFTSDNPPGGKDTYPHDTNRPHEHPDTQKCMSCA